MLGRNLEAWRLQPQRGSEAEPLVGEQGGKDLLKLTNFSQNYCSEITFLYIAILKICFL